MRIRPLRSFIAVALATSALAAQDPPKPPSRLKRVAAKIADTVASAAAAIAVDSALGEGGRGLVAAVMGKDGPTCPPGYVVIDPNHQVVPSARPSAGSSVVGAVKQAARGNAPTTGTPGTGLMCAPVAGPGDPSSPSEGPVGGGQPGMPDAGSVASAMVGVTPIGAAVVAAPVAVGVAKAVGGLIRGGDQSKESMIKELARGRLVLKGIRFLPASDALEDPIDDDLGALGEALAAMEGTFVLNLPPEAADADDDPKTPAVPDTAMAARRLQKLGAALAVAGIPEERLVLVSRAPRLDPRQRFPKRGEARVEVLPLPPGFER